MFVLFICFPAFLSGWLKSLIPKSALSVEEEAWNAYPYTKTRFTCPFVEKFSIEVETYYYNDGGNQENVFNLSKSEMKQREIGEHHGINMLLMTLMAFKINNLCSTKCTVTLYLEKSH